MSQIRRRRPAAAGLVAALALALSACGDGVSPGVAAQVGEEQITVDEVDELATLICDIDKASGQAGRPMAANRATALTVLLAIEIGGQIGDVDEVPQERVTQSLEAAAGARELLPADQHDYFDQVVGDSTRAAAAVEAEAAERLAASGEEAAPEALQREAVRLQQQFAEESSVEVDRRFGVYRDGQVVSADGSLSVAVSDRALGFIPQGDDPAAAPAGDLPASQVCG